MQQVDIYVKEGCPFCVRAERLLQKRNVSYNRIDVTFDGGLFTEMQKRSNGGKTVPQIFVGATHVGGSDDLSMMPRAEFMALLEGRQAA